MKRLWIVLAVLALLALVVVWANLPTRSHRAHPCLTVAPTRI